jgi:hypothetical protein
VWGRKGGVWWELSGLGKGTDPRSAQGLVAVKVADGEKWRDLLALRPREGGPSSAWTLSPANGGTAVPVFTNARGSGGRTVLTGFYRRTNGHRLMNGHQVTRAKATLLTTADGIKLSVRVPAKATLSTTIWLAGASAGVRGGGVSARNATTTRDTCRVTASGLACPVTVSWRNHGPATLEVGS